MDSVNQLDDKSIDPKLLLGQLNTARKEINNLRQQIKSLKYTFEKDVNGIKQLIGIYSNGSNSHHSSPAISSSIVVEPSSSSSGSQINQQQQQPDSILMEPIGIINTGFPNKRGTPRQPGICKESRGKITLLNSVFTNPEHALNGLDGFSHMWILFHFHKNESTHIRAKVAPPRLNGVRTGVFSTRSPHRPCPIGLSLVKIIKIEGNIILFEGVDIIDGTPVFDIKPYIPQYDNPLHVESIIRRENHELTDDLNGPILNSLTYPDNDFGSLLDDSCQLITDDISRDEEIALRLQAEEFEQVPVNNDDNNTNFENLASQITNERSDNLDTTDSSIVVATLNEESRNSRLLDGADGPNTVWGTDMDFISRRSLNTRLDNSPVRMGVREAPDGEEGLESQSLRPSQTIGNIQNIPTTISSSRSINTNSLQNLSEVSTDEMSSQFQVRVPDWITQSHSRSLSVIFNDRALRQLTDIVHEKTDEQKRAIENVLREDPRSVYLRQRWANQFYTFLIHDLHISCRFDDNRGIVSVFQIRPAGRICECGEPEWQCLGHSPIS